MELATVLGDKGVPLLGPLITDRRETLRLRAITAAGALGEKGAALVPDLARALLGDDNPDLRIEAARALTKMGEKASAARSKLGQALKDPEPKVRIAAIESLAKIGVDDDTISPLLEMLMDRGATVAAVAGKVLKDSGKLKSSHIPALDNVLKKGPKDGRIAAMRLLVELASKWGDAVTAIATATSDDDDAIRIEAIRSLAEVGPTAWRSVPTLTKSLRDTDDKIKKATMLALAKIGPKASAAAPDLIAMLKDKTWHDNAAATLVAIGKGSVPALLETLDNTKYFKSRIELINLIGDIGPDAQEAIKPLAVMAEEERLPGIKAAARKALAKIQAKKK
jgi:HEAT repeat protein